MVHSPKQILRFLVAAAMIALALSILRNSSLASDPLPVNSAPGLETDQDASVHKIAPVQKSDQRQAPDELDVFVSEENGSAARAVQGARVTLAPAGNLHPSQTLTADNGQVTFEGLVDGQAYLLTVIASGYDTAARSIVKAPGHMDIGIGVDKRVP